MKDDSDQLRDDILDLNLIFWEEVEENDNQDITDIDDLLQEEILNDALQFEGNVHSDEVPEMFRPTEE
ncbi:hypothetical protein scyTo_0001406 [Scyliorhinus torazame]|uniref:Uncharacterized protein n=1 Tax=Scyliorhinus torazame TaxID=75743 RepID=A0A401PCR3_SCYTO|nr:hypothetical protein [Scyliorhinus torazame]